MGEYARFQGEEVKIGTCEWLYYLRWQDRGKVQPIRGNVRPGVDLGLSYRLPIPAEDSETPGGYSSGWGMVDLPGFQFTGDDARLSAGPFRLYAVKHAENADGAPVLVPCVTDGREHWSLSPDVDAWPDIIAAVECETLRARLEICAIFHGPAGTAEELARRRGAAADPADAVPTPCPF